MIVTTYALKFRTAVLVFTVVLIVAGVFFYQHLPREGFPDITIPFVFVTAPYDGTAPSEVEKHIAIPLEKRINEVEGIKEMRSFSLENLCFLSVEFLAGVDIDTARQKVKDKVDLAGPELPEDLEPPLVEALNFNTDVPVYMFTLSGGADPRRLKGIAEGLQDEIEQQPGVKEVSLAGIREREIRVELDLPRLAALRLPLGQVLQRIGQENATVTAGHLETAEGKFQVRVPGEFALAGDVREVVVAERDGRPVYLTDVGEVRDTFKDDESRSRINGEPCVSVLVKKRVGENAVKLIADVRGVLDRRPLPAGVRRTDVFDQAQYIDEQIRDLENNIFTGFVLVVLLLLTFMGIRNSLFVALAIPMSMFGTFLFMAGAGATLNMMTLFSLVLVIGMLVDNAIVIVENIYRLRTEGLSRIEAARRGAAEVAWPVTTSTLTTVAAFAPLMWWPGVTGQFMGYLPWTVIVALMASLFVALVINPPVCSVFIHARRRDRRERRHPFIGLYGRVLEGALAHRGAVLLLGFLFLVLSVQVYAWLERGWEFFPDVPPRNAYIYLKLPQGTPIDRTDAVIREIEGQLARHPDIRFFQSNIGVGAGQDPVSGGVPGGTEQASIRLEFVEIGRRRMDSRRLVDLIREEIRPIPGAVLVVQQEEQGPPTGAPVQIEISGEDFEVLADLAGQVRRAVADVPGLVDVRDDLEDALPELQVRVDRKRAALFGLDTRSIGTHLRMSFFGIEAGRFRAGKDEYDITLRLPAEQRNTLDVLRRVSVTAPDGRTVPLSSLAAIRYAAGRGEIRRKDQRRMVTVSGNILKERALNRVLDDVRARVGRIDLPEGFHVTYAGQNKDANEAGLFLGRAMLVACALILIILVIQFNSVLVPLIILFSVVLSMLGVMWGLILSGLRFDLIMTGLGVISLAGVVVNNAIVLIDCIHQRRAEGMDARAAIVQAGMRRLRPVLLTAVTTVLGLIPMAVGWSVEIHRWPWRLTMNAESSGWWAPMAVAVIYGLLVATLLTLVLVPAMYSLLDDLSAAVRRRFGGEDGSPDGSV